VASPGLLVTDSLSVGLWGAVGDSGQLVVEHAFCRFGNGSSGISVDAPVGVRFEGAMVDAALLVVAALAAGALAGVGEVGSAAVREVYGCLRDRVRLLLGADRFGRAALDGSVSGATCGRPGWCEH